MRFSRAGQPQRTAHHRCMDTASGQRAASGSDQGGQQRRTAPDNSQVPSDRGVPLKGGHLSSTELEITIAGLREVLACPNRRPARCPACRLWRAALADFASAWATGRDDQALAAATTAAALVRHHLGGAA
jgi:hypothetical protein